MDLVIVVVALIGSFMSGFDFIDLFFYISLAISIQRQIRNYTHDKLHNKSH